jgi:glycine cleavage system H protein
MGAEMDLSKLLYTKSHEWVAIEGDIGTVGITAFAVEQLTDVTHLELPTVGKAVTAEKPFGEIESVKAVFDLNSPVSGEIIEVNDAVKSDPSIINSDNYGRGWMIKVKITAGASTSHLKDLKAYEEQLANDGH